MPRPTRGSQKATIKREEDDIDEVKASKPRDSAAATKRKAASEPDVDVDSKTQGTKAVKKRKGKGKGDEEAMILAERTAVSGLGKAMYIGAHVSAAGGISTLMSFQKL